MPRHLLVPSLSPLCTTLIVPCLMLGFLLARYVAHPSAELSCANAPCDSQSDELILVQDPDARYDHLRIHLAQRQYRIYRLACRRERQAATIQERRYAQDQTVYALHNYQITRQEVTPDGAQRAGLP